MDNKKTRSPIPKRKRVQITFTKPSLTKQSFKNECDINTIVQRFQNTGQIPVQNTLDPQYGIAPDLDLKTALDHVKDLQREFDDLKPQEKQIFDNNPEKYASFLSQYDQAPESFYREIIDESDTLVSKTPKVSPETPPDTKS